MSILKTLNHLINCIPTSVWSSSRIRPWSSTPHLIHHSTQYCALLLILYTTPLSTVLYSSSYTPLLSVLSPTPNLIHHSTQYCATVISNSSANHQLCANDRPTQLLLSFSALDFSRSITHLENTLTNVAN